MGVLFGRVLRLVFVLVLLSPENDFLDEREKRHSRFRVVTLIPAV